MSSFRFSQDSTSAKIYGSGVSAGESKDMQMTFDQFMGSVADARPPNGLSPALAALWWIQKGDWERAHALVNERSGPDDAWVHAHLHRVEGDQGNAGYWYRRSGKAASSAPLETERETIAKTLLGGSV